MPRPSHHGGSADANPEVAETQLVLRPSPQGASAGASPEAAETLKQIVEAWRVPLLLYTDSEITATRTCLPTPHCFQSRSW